MHRGVGGFWASWALLVLWPMLTSLQAQVVDGTRWSSGAVDLAQGWRTHEGDEAAWAEARFDDSAWPAAELDDLGPARQESRWFRLHLKLASGHPHADLLIVGGYGVYAAYVNSEEVRKTRLRPWFALRRPVEEVVSIADDATDVTIAFRTHATQMYALWHLPLFLTAAVGSSNAIENEREAFESQRLYAAVPSIAINTTVVLAGIGAFALFRSQRTHAEYMCWGCIFFCWEFRMVCCMARLPGFCPWR